ncbi:PEBP-like protein [Atractiella rhizophila]|nr:PEBP-like protein [Atractiella rhizophila]
MGSAQCNKLRKKGRNGRTLSHNTLLTMLQLLLQLILLQSLTSHVAAQTANFTISNIRGNLTEAEIIPQILPPIQPAFSLPFSFSPPTGEDLGLVQPGSNVSLANSTAFPTLFASFTSTPQTPEQISFLRSQLWFLAIVDPDAPSRLTPTVGQVIHFLGGNFTFSTYTIRSPKDDLTLYRLSSLSDPLVPWAPADPIPGSGSHRFVISAYIQPSNLSSSLSTIGFDPTKDNFSRSNFNVTDFASKTFLARPVAASWWTTERPANFTLPTDDQGSAAGRLCWRAWMGGVGALLVGAWGSVFL